MASYAQASDVQARVQYRDINATSKPSLNDVQVWIDDAEAAVNNALLAIGLAPVPMIGANAIRIIKLHVVEYALGCVLNDFANSGGDPNNSNGQGLIDRFMKWIEDIFNNRNYWADLLTGGSSGPSQQISGDFGTLEPIFVRDSGSFGEGNF